MKKNLIIGAGQLGSRHLQGLLKLEANQEIYVLDPSEASLTVARERAAEIPNTHTVRYITDWQDLPIALDLVIVATGAAVRKPIVTKLLNEFKVNYLVLEKVLFQDVESHNEIAELIKQKQVPVWVNHSRRMLRHYQHIKQQLGNNKVIKMHVMGANWGLGCNTLHFIDLCSFLTGAPVRDIRTAWVDDEVFESKRPGYMEFTGTINGRMANESCFTISSLKGSSNLLTVFISTGDESWIVEEAMNACFFHQKLYAPEQDEKQPLKVEYQSSLTKRLAEDIFETGTCALPTYEQARASHVPFIEAILKKYNAVTGVEHNICPIT